MTKTNRAPASRAARGYSAGPGLLREIRRVRGRLVAMAAFADELVTPRRALLAAAGRLGRAARP